MSTNTFFTTNRVWQTGVRQLETSDPVLGGPDGVSNVAPRQLAWRTDFLLGALELVFGRFMLSTGGLPAELITPVASGGTGLKTIAVGSVLVGAENNKYQPMTTAQLLNHLGLTSRLSNIDNALNSKANSSHTHAISNIDNLQDELNKKANTISPAFTGIPTAPTASEKSNSLQIATTAFVVRAINNLIGTAPETLNTLEEIAAALGGDENIKQVLLNEIAKKADKSTSLEGYGIVDGIKVVGTAPSQKVGDVIYVIDKACFMRWQTIGSWTGYASDQLGALVAGTTKTPRTNEIDAIGQTVNKSRYPGLWAFAQHNGLVVPSSSWRAGTYYFVDLGGDNFKVPDERNMFIRFTGTDADSANPRELGSYQKGSLFVSDTAVGGFYLSTLAFDSASHLNVGGIDLITTASTDYPGVKVAVSTPGSVRSTADSNLFHFGVTRPTNTAFSPRIVAF